MKSKTYLNNDVQNSKSLPSTLNLVWQGESFPHLKKTDDSRTQEDWELPVYTQERLSHFHFLKGKSGEHNLIPLLSDELYSYQQYLKCYPIYMPQYHEDFSNNQYSVWKIINSHIPESDKKGMSAGRIRSNLSAFLRVADSQCREDRLIPFNASFIEGITEEFMSTLEIDEQEKILINKDFFAIKNVLPKDGFCIGLSEHTNLQIALLSLLMEKKIILDTYLEHLKSTLSRLKEFIHLQESHQSIQIKEAPPSKDSELNYLHINPEQLAQILPDYRGSQVLSIERLDKLKKSCRILEDFLESHKNQVQVLVLHSSNNPISIGEFKNVEFRYAETPLAEAQKIFKTESEQYLEIIRAMKLAQIELDGIYDPEIHDGFLEGLKWDSLNAEEKGVEPTIFIWDTLSSTLEKELGELVKILQSKERIKICLEFSSFGAKNLGTPHFPEEFINKGTTTGLMALAAKETFVLQGTLANPTHLINGYSAFAKTDHPACAIVCVPENNTREDTWPMLNLAWASRVSPCFEYDPEKGDTWAQSFELTGNLQQDMDWPNLAINQNEKIFDEIGTITWAHLAVLNPALENHFFPILEESHYENQLEIASYLRKYSNPNPEAIPYIWVLNNARKKYRAIVSQDIVLSCWKIMRNWKNLQELGGEQNEYVFRALALFEKQLNEKSEKESELLKNKYKHDLDEFKRKEAIRIIEKITRGLLKINGPDNSKSLLIADSNTQINQIHTEATPIEISRSSDGLSQASVPASQKNTAEIDSPYIESELCTSCNDCTNINPRLFLYDENKQAYIGDEKAGTFSQLVKAALKCPAKCIHPGHPRKEDGSATPELIAKAKSLN